MVSRLVVLLGAINLNTWSRELQILTEKNHQLFMLSVRSLDFRIAMSKKLEEMYGSLYDVFL